MMRIVHDFTGLHIYAISVLVSYFVESHGLSRYLAVRRSCCLLYSVKQWTVSFVIRWPLDWKPGNVLEFDSSREMSEHGWKVCELSGKNLFRGESVYCWLLSLGYVGV